MLINAAELEAIQLLNEDLRALTPALMALSTGRYAPLWRLKPVVDHALYLRLWLANRELSPQSTAPIDGVFAPSKIGRGPAQHRTGQTLAQLKRQPAGLAPIEPIACKACNFIPAQQLDHVARERVSALKVVPAGFRDPQKAGKGGTARKP